MSDQVARDEALDIKRSFIVQAPAGSGKTTLLISRYLCLLAVAEQPEEVLAITFTRKATAEMRKRILDALDPNSPPFRQEVVNQAVQTIRTRAIEQEWNLLEQPSRLQIMTIDAFCTSLVRRMPWASRFGSLPGIAEDASEHYQSAVFNLYDSAHQNEGLRVALAVLLQHLDNNSHKLQDLIVELLSKRDQWLRHLMGTATLITDRESLQEIWRTFLAEQLNRTRAMVPVKAREKLGLDNIDSTQPASIREWQQLIRSLLTSSSPADWKKRIGSIDLPAGLTKEELIQVIDLCRDNTTLKNRLLEIRDAFPHTAEYSETQWQVLQACSVVLQHAVAELKLEFRKHGQVDFIEIAEQAVRALGHETSPTDLYLVLDYQYRHVMVDEFQDISVSQRDLLELLVAGWQRDDGRTIFLVGDPMQSIYRFREAEVGIYLSVIENGLGNLTIKPLRLTQNFRSTPDLVSWFNTVFPPSFPPAAEIETGSVPYVACDAGRRTEDQGSESTIKVRLQQMVIRQQEAHKKQLLKQREADLLLADLRHFREQNPGDDVRAAILVRTRQHATLIIDRMIEQEISFYAPDFISLGERPVVEDLLALTRALLNLADRTAWMAVLRAPWCGLGLADLLTIAEDKETSIWHRLHDSNIETVLSEDGWQRLRRIRAVLDKALAMRGRQTMREWIHDCWLLIGGPACYARHDLDNAQLFLDLIEQNARGSSIVGLNVFEDKLAGLFAVPEVGPEESWLHVLTMHGAKGLEYDAIFLPRLHEYRVGFPSPPLLAWSEFFLEGLGNQMLLSPIVATGVGKEGSLYHFLIQWEKKREQIELMRLTYVACTRAKQALYIYASGNFNRPPSTKSMIGMLWPGINAGYKSDAEWLDFIDCAALEQAAELANESTNADQTFYLTRLPSAWQLPEPPAAVKMLSDELESPERFEAIDFDWAGSTALWVGNVVHEWLEKMVRTGVDNWNAERLETEQNKWRTRLLSMGMNADRELMDNALERIGIALNNVLNDACGQWLLSDEHDNSEAELRLTSCVNGQMSNVILDRTFVDKHGIRWIIDYKSGITGGNVEKFLEQEVERYREQLTNYRAVVAGMDSRPIRTGLYFPMFPAWREVL